MSERPRGVRAVGQVGVYGAAQVAQAVLALALVGLLARSMGREGFGIWSYSFVVASLGALIADFGLGPWITRAVAQAPSRTAAIVGDVMRLRLRLVALAWVVTLGVSALVFHDRSRVENVAAMLAYLTMLGYVGVWEGVMLGRAHVTPAAISVSVGKAFELAAVFAALRLGMPATVPAVALTLAAAAAARLALLPWLARPVLRATVPADAGEEAAATEIAPPSGVALLRQVLPFALGAWMWTAYFKVDVLLLERLATPVGLGLYTAAYRVIEAVMMLPRTVIAVTYSRVASAWNGSTLSGGLPATPGRMLLLVSLGAAAGLWVLARPVMGFLFGTAFGDGEVALRVLALALPVLYVNQYLGMVLAATHRQGTWVLLLVGALVVNLGANLLLIPRLGFVGASWATLASEVFLLAAYVMLVTRRHGGLAGPAWFLRAFGAMLGMAIGVDRVPGPLLVRVAVGAVLFALLAFGTGAVSADERALAVATVKRVLGRGAAAGDA